MLMIMAMVGDRVMVRVRVMKNSEKCARNTI
jgi:hypothetical protein